MAEQNDQNEAEHLQTPPLRSLIPIPDPSLLSTAALEREIKHLREIVTSEIVGRSNLVDRRFADMDKAIELLETWRVTQRESTADDVEHGVRNVQSLIEAKLLDLVHQMAAMQAAIDNQIHDQDRRFEQSKLDSKAAIDAALQAAKEAVGKTELVTDKQIAGIQVLIAANTKSSDDKLDALKDRFNDDRNRVNGLQSGAAGVVTGGQQARAALYAAIGVIVIVLSAVIGLVSFAIANASP